VVATGLTVLQGDIWLADLGQPVGSIAGYVRPVVIIQGNLVNASRLTTYLAVPQTSNARRMVFPTSVLLNAKQTGLEYDSVAQPTLTLAVAEEQLLEHVGTVSAKQLHQLFERLDIALGRT
jgi:mRNA interferase MazF